MNATDVRRAAAAAAIDTISRGEARDVATWQLECCYALQTYALPVLRNLHKRSTGWRVWLKVALGLVIGAMQEYVNATCGEERRS